MKKMKLTLIRHGEAHPAVQGQDHIRPLTELGHQQAEKTAQYLKDMIQPDAFIVSPLLRAQETLAHLHAYFPDVPVLVYDGIKPDDDADVAIQWLSQLDYQSIVVVCHMNVVAYIDEILTAQSLIPFALAEARIYEQTVISDGLSTRVQQFIP